MVIKITPIIDELSDAINMSPSYEAIIRNCKKMGKKIFGCELRIHLSTAQIISQNS